MSADAARHRELAQERLELRGWMFTPVPPGLTGQPWRVVASHSDTHVSATFTKPQRHDALGNALHFAMMVDGGANDSSERDTLPAPPMVESHAAE